MDKSKISSLLALIGGIILLVALLVPVYIISYSYTESISGDEVTRLLIHWFWGLTYSSSTGGSSDYVYWYVSANIFGIFCTIAFLGASIVGIMVFVASSKNTLDPEKAGNLLWLGIVSICAVVVYFVVPIILFGYSNLGRQDLILGPGAYLGVAGSVLILIAGILAKKILA